MQNPVIYSYKAPHHCKRCTMRWWSKEGPARHTARPFPATETVIQQNSLLSFCILYVVWPFEIDMYGKRKKGGFLLMSLPFNPQKSFCNCFRSFFTRRNSFEPINQGTSEDAGTQGFIFVFQTNFQSRKPFPYPFQIQII